MNEHVSLRTPATQAGYDADFFAWTQEQAELMRQRRFDELDLENIAEEIESLGKSDRRSIESQLARLIAQLLKLQYSTDVPPRSGWKESVDDARSQIELTVEDSPSLRRKLPDFFMRQLPKGMKKADAGLSVSDRAAFSPVEQSPPLTLEQALDPDFFPGD